MFAHLHKHFYSQSQAPDFYLYHTTDLYHLDMLGFPCVDRSLLQTSNNPSHSPMQVWSAQVQWGGSPGITCPLGFANHYDLDWLSPVLLLCKPIFSSIYYPTFPLHTIIHFNSKQHNMRLALQYDLVSSPIFIPKFP